MNALFILIALVAYGIAGWLLYTRNDIIKFVTPIHKTEGPVLRTVVGILAMFTVAAVLAFGGAILKTIGSIALLWPVLIILCALAGWASYTKQEPIKVCGPLAAIENDFVRTAYAVVGVVVAAVILAFGGSILTVVGKILLSPVLVFF